MQLNCRKLMGVFALSLAAGGLMLGLGGDRNAEAAGADHCAKLGEVYLKFACIDEFGPNNETPKCAGLRNAAEKSGCPGGLFAIERGALVSCVGTEQFETWTDATDCENDYDNVPVTCTDFDSWSAICFTNGLL